MAREPSISSEKELHSSHHEVAEVDGVTEVNTSGIDEKALLRKIDWHVVPWLSFLYLLSFLDRSTIGNARLYNMEGDLHISDMQYLIALTTFFFPYAFFEMPSNIVLKRLKPSRWLSFLMLMWGIVLTLHGVIRNYASLVALRFLLGLFEAGLYPGVVFYLSCWYKRSELGTRAALFSSAATTSGAFGGLLAAAIANMGGVGGRPSWAWIFILEGLVTILAGIASFWIVQDFPDTARFLTEEERAFVVHRLQADQQFSAAGEKFKKKYIWQCLTDMKSLLGAGIYMGIDGPNYAFSLFTPTIINQARFGATVANLLSVPVYVWASLVTCFVGVLGDRIGQRAYINMGLFSIAMTGYIMLVASRNAALSYFAIYLAAPGIYACIPNTVAWVSSNTEGSYKRGAAFGLLIGWGNLQGAVTSNVYRANDKPWYPLGHGIILAYIVIGLISSFALRVVLKAENAKRARGERDEIIRGALAGGEGRNEKDGVYESVQAAREDKGDKWSGFRYSL